MKGKTAFITGATRGIGRAIALKLAAQGANVVVTGKTAQPHAKLRGTIHTVTEEIEQLGGNALAIQLDVRDCDQIQARVEQAADHFGGIDILINNASAISLTDTESTTMKRFDLMMQVNMRATFACAHACLPYLKMSECAHVLTMSPPLNMQAKWFEKHVAYTMSKYGMSMCTLGMAAEFKQWGIAVNSLWPATTIATDAIAVNFPKEIYQCSRDPAIVADAVMKVVSAKDCELTGQFLIDEAVLSQYGMTDFSSYAVDATKKPYKDLFLN